MSAALSPSNLQLKNRILLEAAKYIHKTGFTTAALTAALKIIDDKQINGNLLAHIFNRGFPIALVEYVVKSTNQAVQRELELNFSKDAVVRSIEANLDNFVRGRYRLPTESDVVERAVLKKLELIKPMAAQWPNAVILEYYPSNVPYTVINVAEFVDTTAYYMERVATLNELLEPVRLVLQSKAMASHFHHAGAKDNVGLTATTFFQSFLRGIPLSSGPHAGHSGLNPSWYFKRVQLALLYATVTTSLLGDVSKNAADTRVLTQKVVKSFF